MNKLDEVLSVFSYLLFCALEDNGYQAPLCPIYNEMLAKAIRNIE